MPGGGLTNEMTSLRDFFEIDRIDTLTETIGDITCCIAASQSAVIFSICSWMAAWRSLCSSPKSFYDGAAVAFIGSGASRMVGSALSSVTKFLEADSVLF